MARTDNLGNFLTDVAESIRLKRGITTKIACCDYDKEIEAIETGKEPVLQYKQVTPSTQLQRILCDDGYDGLGQVEIQPVDSSIDSNIISNNIREGVNILGVDGSMKEGIIPNGLINITSNGTYDVTEYSGATVSVGDTTITKGIITNTTDSDGYVTDASIIGIENIPEYYMGSNAMYYDGTNGCAYLAGRIKTVSSLDAKSIGNYSFAKITSLESVYFPEVKTIKNSAFSDSGLQNAYMPKLETIGTSAFSNSKITSIEGFESLTTCAESSFASCSNILTLKFPPKLSILPIRLFSGCSGINNIIFTPTITEIKDRVFYQCTGLLSVDIPSTVVTLGTYIFYQCTALENVTIRGDRTTIPTNTFGRCTMLSKVCLPDVTSVPSIDSYVFKDSGIASGIGYVYVPDNLVDSFKTASVWKNYADQIKPLSELV